MLCHSFDVLTIALLETIKNRQNKGKTNESVGVSRLLTGAVNAAYSVSHALLY